jgi:hypothetical protein
MILGLHGQESTHPSDSFKTDDNRAVAGGSGRALTAGLRFFLAGAWWSNSRTTVNLHLEAKRLLY